ncbi:MAG TPA: response regulator [Pyrinomonadaceae bacterium]|jgi:CheY-like chemotaxis protein|nr:response regulator [Pyrinomonadaceae bacterium]
MSNPSNRPAGEGRRTVLVVDDFEDTRRVLRLWLERMGYDVKEAADGLEAVEAALTLAPDLIILDIEMPELDGLESARRIRQHEGLREVPIIAVSAYGAEQYRARALAAGCTEYVSTPFDPKELKSLINSYVPPTGA